MKFKRFIYVGIVLGASLFVCYIAWQQHVQSFLGRLHPPSVDQVRKWAGFPESAHLTMLTNVPDDVGYYDDDLGKFKWFWTYEDRKGSNFNCVVIVVYKSGRFWPTKRALLINASERQKHIDNGTSKNKEGEALARELGPIIMPNGQKSYGFLLGLAPGRFAPHSEFDVVAYEIAKPESYDERHPPADLPAMATNSFSEFFTNVDAFLTSE